MSKLAGKGDYKRRRSWARQSSGALLCCIPTSGDSGYGFRLKAVLQTLRKKWQPR